MLFNTSFEVSKLFLILCPNLLKDEGRLISHEYYSNSVAQSNYVTLQKSRYIFN